MNIAMILDSARLLEATATLASLVSHISRPTLTGLYIFTDDTLEAATCDELKASLRAINGCISVTWVTLAMSQKSGNIDAVFHLLQYLHGKKVLIISHAVLFLHDVAKIYDSFSDTYALSGVRDYAAGFRSESICLTADTPYINDSLIWANLTTITPEHLATLRETIKCDPVTALLCSNRQDFLNRVFMGHIDIVPATWISSRKQNNEVLSLASAIPQCKERKILLLRDDIGKGSVFCDKIRFSFIKKTRLAYRYVQYKPSFSKELTSKAISQTSILFKTIYDATLRNIVSLIQEKIEYAHALTFRHIRNRLLEINAQRKKNTDFSFRNHAQYDTVLTLENEKYVYGEYGIKNTYNLLFSINAIKHFENKNIKGKTAIFFHILRNSKIKKQIDILLMAVADEADFYFVETGFVNCVTNINVASIPLRFRKTSSYIVDDMGFYYDAMLPTRLESYLNSGASALNAIEHDRATRLIRLLVTRKLSKYNYLRLCSPPGLLSPAPKILVVDQSKRDASVIRGMADETTFRNMLEAAIQENPDAEILVKTHPDSIHRGRGSYYSQVRSEGRIKKISESINPYALLEHVTAVYVCTSHLGLEALLLGDKQVHVFGMPAYAGWGLSKDRQKIARRTRTLSLQELVHALYIKFSLYFDPLTGEKIEVERYLKRMHTLRDEYYSLYDNTSFCIANKFCNVLG